ncbi:nuclear transport factor 2 family protein [Kutzneria kofuensis]|uniref:SnoaL-like domain-containing protein n=1 Tax=Kutzneria kofuensis TaxID=103725 RepID=A0A7W9NKU5_9PSEU|nr:nuclear transport factor 2 family protein [Kutzneria kofuensis]MBB5897007.1 hypothetical protein [Kutzneria kofuensis]
MSNSETDRAAIVETCTRMAWLADQRRWEELVEQFTDDVAVDYTSLNGGAPVRVRGRDLVAGWRAGLSGFDATQHLVSNHLVAIDGDTAVVTAAFQATHVLPNQRGGPIWRIGGDYRYELVRADGWRISAVTMTMTWSEGNFDLLALAASAGESDAGAVR